MKRRFVAKVFAVLMVFAMLFSVCALTVNAVASNETSRNATARNDARQTTKPPKRPTYTETLQEVNKRLPPESQGFWRDGIKELKEVKSYDNLGATVITQFANCIEDGDDADLGKIGFELLKGVVNMFASCYGMGGISNALFNAIEGFGEEPQSEIDILSEHLDEQFGEMHDHLDEIQENISELSLQVDASTQTILDALAADDAKDKVITFMSGTEGNFNYRQFKSFLYGATDAGENPYYYTQAYYNNLVESIVNNPPSSDEVIKEHYDALYRSLASTSRQDESNIGMLYDYLLYDEQSGEYSIQRYYYDYLCANSEFLGDRNAEYEALQFTLDLYTTALFAEHCIVMCNNYQLMCMYETYGASPSAYDKYYFSDTDEYIYFGDLIKSAKASEARQADLEKQIADDVAYILNLEGSVVVQDDNNKTRLMDAADELAWGYVQAGQTVYLHKMADEWCEFFGFEKSAFTYEWYSGELFIAKNDGIFLVSESYPSFEGFVKYNGKTIYTINFVVGNAPSFLSGDGSENDPYVINNAEQFKLINDGLDDHYILVHDIDFSNVSFSPIGSEDKPFSGTINGNGYAIKNLIVSANEYVGVFGYIGDQGVVKNLNIQKSGFIVDNDNVEVEKIYSGSIAAINAGTILNCYVSNCSITINAQNNQKQKHVYAFAGGIAGQSESNGRISYCQIDHTSVSTDLTHDYGSSHYEYNSTNAFAAGIVSSLVENASVNNCYVASRVVISSNAFSIFHDWNNNLHATDITVRSSGGVALADDTEKIKNIWSEAIIGLCEYGYQNTGLESFGVTTRCSAESDQYITAKKTDQKISEEQKNAMKANSKESIVFPNQTLYDTITYSFGGKYNEVYKCYEDQLYYCNEESIKLDNLNIQINGQEVDHTIISYYYFDTLNSNKYASKSTTVIITFSAKYMGQDIVERICVPITISENTAVSLEIVDMPDKTVYSKNDDISLEGGGFALRYQDGSTTNVTSFVKSEGDTSVLGQTQVIVTYGDFSTSYTIVVLCYPHHYIESIVAPTCTSGGYTVYTCEYCFDTYRGNYVQKTPHQTIMQNGKDATCTEEGKYADIVCAVCRQVIELGQVIPPVGHDFANGEKDVGAHGCYTCGHKEEHLFRTTEYESEVLCTCVICDYQTKFNVNSREKISKLPRIVVSDAYALNGENEVVVYLELFSEVGITGAEFSVYFGDDLELVSYEYGNILNKPLASAFNVLSDHLNVVLAGAAAQYTNKDYEAPNTLLKLVFRTPCDAVAGNEYPILILNKTEQNNDATVTMDKFTSAKGEQVDFLTVNGKIRIVDRLPGDVVGDGTIDVLDAVIIAQYIVKEDDERVDFLAETKLQYNSFDISYGDVTLNNLYDVGDVVQILRYIVGGYEARVLAKEFFVKLNYNDGSGREETIAAKYNDNGQILLDGLTAAKRDGYRFDGWYYGFTADASKLGDEYKWNYDAIEQTLYAHYTLNYISFFGNGATSNSMESISYGDMDRWIVSTEFEKTSNVFFDCNCYDSDSKKITVSHSFRGWADTPDGTIIHYPGDIIDLKNGEIGNIKLYAIWSTEYIALPTLERIGYNLKEWASDEKGLVIAGKVNDTYAVDGNTTVYAKWDSAVINYTIIYDGNGSTEGYTTDNTVYSVKTQNPLAHNGYSKIGYQFNGWNTKADGTGLKYDNEEMVSYIPSETDGVATLYAQWKPNNYEIVFRINTPTHGEASHDIMPNVECTYDQELTLPQNSFKINGWIFRGWSRDSFGEVEYIDGATVENLTSTQGGKTNLWAVWEVDPCTVSQYVLNGHVVSDTHGRNSYTVYKGISNTPWSPPAGKVIFDWSQDTNTNVGKHTRPLPDWSAHRPCDMDIYNGTEDIYFVGDKNKTYTSFRLFIAQVSSNQNIVIHFVNFKFESHGSVISEAMGTVNMDLTIDVIGECSIEVIVPEHNAIDMPSNRVTFTGDGTLKIQAGHGRDATTEGGSGSDGGSAIIADNLSVNMDLTGKLVLTGGDGGNGFEGSEGTSGDPGSRRDWVGGKAGNGGTGGTGGTGGNGGAGGAAIIAKKVNIIKGTVICQGGKGGDGGQGGKGGTGGHGGCSNSWGTKGGDGGKGGTGGTGGNGRYGAVAVDCSDIIVSSSGVLNRHNGDNGKKGLAGDGGIGGEPGYYDGAGSDSGEARKGSKGEPGDPGTAGNLV